MKNENVKVILFLGYHVDCDDAKEAILKIKEKTNHIPNENKILLIEHSGWAFGTGMIPVFTNQFDDKTLEKKFLQIEDFYSICIKKIKENQTLIGEEIDWGIILFEYGYKNGYIVEFEKPNLEITKIIFSEAYDIFNEKLQHEIQLKRDEFFVSNQVIPLIKKYPDKTVLIVRGEEHADLLSEILKKHKIHFEVIFYTSQKRKDYFIMKDKERIVEANKLLNDFKKKIGMP